MALEIPGWREAASWRAARAVRVRFYRFTRRLSNYLRFNSITWRIIVLNLAGVTILVAGIFYINQYRVKFIETRVESLTTQAAIIASAIGQTSKTTADQLPDGVPTDDENKIVVPHGLSSPEFSFRIDPEIVSPMLRDLVGPTGTRARVFDTEGTLISDSRQLYPRTPPARAEGAAENESDILSEIWTYLKGGFWTQDLPIYKDMGPDGKAYDEVRVALTGSPAQLIRVTESGETVISIAMPVQREQAILGALFMTAQGSAIDDLIAQERLQIMAIAGLVVAVTALLSLYLAGTIAEPMRRLAFAAERVRKNIKNREQIPDFSDRPDEIGNLSRALRDMTNALYSRLDAIESFAADVSHELKNPLTSLRNAASLLPAVKQEDDRKKLTDIIVHDVRRLDRLITDISDASRLDAELARETARPVNMASLLNMLCEITRENRAAGLNVVLSVQGYATPDLCASAKEYYVNGHDSRLGQVVVNLIENAISFSPKGGSIYVSAKKLRENNQIEISIEDEGPGIREENLEKIFRRFYTDRPESFGNNSGLGLNISQQIVKAHGGAIWAENRQCPGPPSVQRPRKPRKQKGAVAKPYPPPECGKEEEFACGVTERYSHGARFVIRLPACAAG